MRPITRKLNERTKDSPEGTKASKSITEILHKHEVNPEIELYHFKVNKDILNNFTPEELKDLASVFETVDGNSDGYINEDELSNLLKILTYYRNQSHTRKIINRNAVYRLRQLNFIETCHALMDLDVNSTYDLMDEYKAAFNIMDSDKTGEISFENIQQHSQRLNLNFTKYELKKMLELGDVKGKGSIEFSQFLTIMQDTFKYI
ncbi:hypothetical protein A3Q56_06043 [Intoshia linei]|uniref:EF-hand domain-containing protein n=1 Tax=Intoshia linei TaxID=1819745 RepID=A0A177AW44_9BILA|nr:hypothetical protein A3Q56_06043 [Intoshia linei]